MSDFDHLIVHCTATYAHQTQVDAAWVDRVHRERGFSGCGYHEVITRDGQRQNFLGGYPTRPLDRPGAHVGDCGRGWNKRALGVSLAGGLDGSGRPENNFLPRQLDALREAIAEYRERYPRILEENVKGHRDLIRMTGAPPKACPCFSVREVLGLGRSGLAYSPDRPAPSSPLRVPYGVTVRAGDTLWAISAAYGVSIPLLTKLNPGLTSNIVPGQTIILR